VIITTLLISPYIEFREEGKSRGMDGKDGREGSTTIPSFPSIPSFQY
jgi:hypothetical protein